MPDGTPILELRDVSKSFSGTLALDRVSIAIEPGEILCLLGDNGAGKSTLIKVLSGYHQPTLGPSSSTAARPASAARATPASAASPPSTRTSAASR